MEKGLAIEVKSNEDGSFTRNDIATSLRESMVGKKIIINTRETAAIVGNLKLDQDHCIAAFVQFLKIESGNKYEVEDDHYCVLF